MSPKHPPNLPIEAQGLSQSEALAIAGAVAWMVVVGILFLLLPEAQSTDEAFKSIRWTLMAIVIFTPIALILVAMRASRDNRALKSEVLRLRTAIEGLRHTYVTQQGAQGAPAPAKPTAPAKAQPAPAAAPTFASKRAVSRLIVPTPEPLTQEDQPALDLADESDGDAAILDRTDLVRALNFPNDENDTEGFEALRRALHDRTARLLVQASQDILTLLAQDGIYTDEFALDPVDPVAWRLFAQGTRGAAVAKIVAYRNDVTQEVLIERLRSDAVFRDAAHHFLRRFDELLEIFAPEATDTDLIAFADTRTSRAFMILARASHVFD